MPAVPARATASAERILQTSWQFPVTPVALLNNSAGIEIDHSSAVAFSFDADVRSIMLSAATAAALM
jgi:hypothetical protein